VFGDALAEIAGTKHDGEVSDLAVIRFQDPARFSALSFSGVFPAITNS